MADNSVDICVTSPPYWGQRGDDGIGTEKDPREYVRNLTEILIEVMRTLKPSGLLWLNIGDSYNTPINWSFEDHIHSTLGADKKGLPATNSAYTKNRGSRRAFIDKKDQWLQYGNLLMLPNRVVMGLCDAGNLYRGEVIWAKRKAMPEGRCRRPHRKHECIYVIAKSERHAFRVSPPVPSVWDIKPDMNKTPHTSTFPLDLPIKCIEASGVASGIVLDPFMGSGTTGLAAKLLGFDYIGFELNPENAEIARERILAGNGALLNREADLPLTKKTVENETASMPGQLLLEADLFQD
ncbi:site-specific DNA-methyltransferase (adenine-specific)/site-specific DNA-methyltransferase (cytosine-N4-specific) [Noviherbaspirillum suwonense]|uniref:Methyltransferase n=2 Tax=Noviherbaspirillum suwonense TaxID=1224511 RepID=A0ABY1PT02_9BURK|nr:site-specific DNA-methyltransferase (adenine-specific)/site-specific DNA-methyltransferase (cytosine-N4-specific) [Noviherbaspirillum suwonense]